MLLNVRSVYSLLKSTVNIDGYVEQAKELDYDTLGIADINVLHGVYEFYFKAQKAGIKPLIGMTVELHGFINNQSISPFLLYAKNYQGYQALIEISYLLSQIPQDIKQIWQKIRGNKENLVLIITDRKNELIQAVIRDQSQDSQHVLNNYRSIMGQNVYLGISIYPLNKFELATLQQFANQNALTMIVGQLVETLEESDAFSLQVLRAIDENDHQLDRSLMHSKGVHYLYPRVNLESMYRGAGLSQVIDNTQQLIKQLNVEIPDLGMLFPKFKTPNNQSADEFLKELTEHYLEQLNIEDKKPYHDRLTHELTIIQQMGFSDYFLIVWDIIKYCREQNIRLGAGRGSAPGALVAYLLKITGVDPIYYELLFERFLNPERYTMPDIDIDIPDNKRGQVLDYVKDKYGYDQVAQIITFGTFGAKQSIRDTLRVLGAESDDLRRWSNSIPTDQNQLMTLERAYNLSDELRDIVNESPENREIFKASLKLEGLPRHTSTHAAAVVIHDEPLKEIVPILDKQDSLLLTQYTMYDVEDIGLLKMDFLGLRNLTILDNILTSLNKEDIKIDIESINKEDPETLQLFQQAETNGVFQFESPGIKRVLKRLKPESFEDIVAVNALYRPGPMQQIDHFIARKHGQESIEYIVPELEPILKNTYGIIVYQEQVMQILVRMGKFSFGQADVLRRAMSKKQADVMESQRAVFIDGALKQGFKEEDANQMYDHIYAFSNYGFNRAHAVAYSTLAFQLAYLKTHYPLAFYQSLINNGSSQNTSTANMINEAKRRLGTIQGVDINDSQISFSIDRNKLRVGFSAIKSMRKELMAHIVEDRQLMGPYHDYLEFLQRLPDKFLNKDSILPLIYVGALDRLGYNRATLVHNLDALMQSVEYSGSNISLFKELEPRIEIVEDYSLIERIDMEREYLGFSLSGHPIDDYLPIIENHQNMLLLENVLNLPENRNVETIGFIQTIKLIQTKKGEDMAFITLSDEFNSIELVVFPNIFRQVHSLLSQHQLIYVKGKTSLNKRGQKQLIANRIDRPDQFKGTDKQQPPQNCFIKVNSFPDAEKQIEVLKELSHEKPGPTGIIIVDDNYRTIKLDSKYNISYSGQTQQKVREIFYNGQVVYK
ncbi:DNA polymerase III subunit alpha [Aerococcaceae bacterium DSM 111022]|nr:DNA polymerase III subunit alpha [Aerococcaceae bacterium DSM 111022]